MQKASGSNEHNRWYRSMGYSYGSRSQIRKSLSTCIKSGMGWMQKNWNDPKHRDRVAHQSHQLFFLWQKQIVLWTDNRNLPVLFKKQWATISCSVPPVSFFQLPMFSAMLSPHMTTQSEPNKTIRTCKQQKWSERKPLLLSKMAKDKFACLWKTKAKEKKNETMHKIKVKTKQNKKHPSSPLPNSQCYWSTNMSRAAPSVFHSSHMGTCTKLSQTMNFCMTSLIVLLSI